MGTTSVCFLAFWVNASSSVPCVKNPLVALGRSENRKGFRRVGSKAPGLARCDPQSGPRLFSILGNFGLLGCGVLGIGESLRAGGRRGRAIRTARPAGRGARRNAHVACVADQGFDRHLLLIQPLVLLG